jgi:hypothetical protein
MSTWPKNTGTYWSSAIVATTQGSQAKGDLPELLSKTTNHASFPKKRNKR